MVEQIEKKENEMGSDIIKISHLTKNFCDVKAVNDLNFKVKRGELFAFLGVNGAGKTTTLKSVVGILQFDQAGWYCTVAGYGYVVWFYINGYHDSTFDFFGGEKSVDCTVSSCDTMAGSSCKTGHAAYFKWDTGDALHDLYGSSLPN